MTSPAAPELYKHHRFPGEIVGHAVWLYYRFSLSHRDVEELLFVRGILVSYEAIRTWCRKFGQQYANHLRRQRPRPGDTWHLAEVFITINKKRPDLWRAVDQDGRASNPLVRPNGFSLPMGLLLNTFDRAGIAGPRPHTAKKCSRDTRCGKRSRA
jgi:putative transposase